MEKLTMPIVSREGGKKTQVSFDGKNILKRHLNLGIIAV
jgi:hypothetical protein